MLKVLHITPHLGGGVGETLSGIIEYSILNNSCINHTVVCLDKLEKAQSFNKIIECGTEVIIQPSISELENKMKEFDIVELEFWNHPIIFKYLCTMKIPKIRLLVWYHNNGLYNPILPTKLMSEAHLILYTSSCSYQSINNTGYVFSCGGFKRFPEQYNKDYNKVCAGYIGGTNFSKLNPDYAEYVNEANIKVKMIGDSYNKEILENQTDKLEFKGYVENFVHELKTINVLAYLLNPYHYGTAENSLLQAMSMGIVSIVLDNKCETQIVINNYNGFVVHNKEEFSEKIKELSNNKTLFKKLGKNASDYVRRKFTIENTEFELNCNYYKLMNKEKREITFRNIFGNTPDEWFLSCQLFKENFRNNGTVDLSNIDKYYKYLLFEKSNGSASYFSKYFPENRMLNLWSKNLKLVQ